MQIGAFVDRAREIDTYSHALWSVADEFEERDEPLANYSPDFVIRLRHFVHRAADFRRRRPDFGGDACDFGPDTGDFPRPSNEFSMRANDYAVRHVVFGRPMRPFGFPREDIAIDPGEFEPSPRDSAVAGGEFAVRAPDIAGRVHRFGLRRASLDSDALHLASRGSISFARRPISTVRAGPSTA